MKKTKLGIVLSGGGAKGAYEVGFLKALAELNIQPEAVAGTSIGALNGALYSATGDTKKTAKVIEALWDDLAQSKVLKVDKMKVVKNLIEVFSYIAPMPISRLAKIAKATIIAGKSQEGLLTQTPIVDRLKLYASEDSIKTGLPFYIGMTASKGNTKDLIGFLGFGKEDAVFKKVQDLQKEDMHKAIMASAALPLLFDGIEVEGVTYRDGCLSSTGNEWGNTPAKPLIELEGCTHLIVCHLNEGSFFDRHDPLFKDVAMIEIRPTQKTFSSGLDPLQFNVSKIEEWKNQGYLDTKRILEESLGALEVVKNRKTVEKEADDAVNKLKNRNFKLG